jgi:Lar family restriction alleviation protein
MKPTTPERSDAVSDELKPCPHCGEEAEIDNDTHLGRVSVYCSMCGHGGFCYEWIESQADAEQKAIAAWNRRAGEQKDAADARRYRWLRDFSSAHYDGMPATLVMKRDESGDYWDGAIQGEQLDAAIDSAIASEAGAT